MIVTDLIRLNCVVIQFSECTFIPSHRDTARSGLSARRVRSALNAPMFPIPAPSAPILITDIYNMQCTCDVYLTTHAVYSGKRPDCVWRRYCSSLKYVMHCVRPSVSCLSVRPVANKCNEKLCKKKKKYGRKSRTNLLLLLCAYVPPYVVTCNILCYIVILTYISSTIGCANFGPDWPLLFKVHEIWSVDSQENH